MIQREPIAVVGVAAIFPGSADACGFWNDILRGRDLLADVPPHYWLVDDYYDPDPAAPDKTYGRRGAFLTPLEFDTLEFGIPPSALPAIDSAQLLALLGAKRVLADAARDRPEHVPKDRISVFLGAAAATSAAMHMAARLQRPAWIKGMRESGIPESQIQEACDRIAACFTPLQENTFPGILSNVITGRIANRFDLRGTNFTTDAACASSLAAVSVGINDLYLGNSDMVLTGGVDALNDIQMFMCFSKTPALSPSGDCRPFSSQSDGTMLGEGLSMFALRRLSDAERDGDKIYAVIRGLGASSDGLSKSVYAPRPEGQSIALRRAYEAAGYGPETVELVEGHGTATAAGDQAEFEALREVFGGANPSGRQWCALGSVKSQIGHTKGAAGAAGLFKTVMALHHKMLPPTIKVDQPNPAMAIRESPFYLNTEARPWIRGNDSPRRASLSSFGFGGTNFHMTLEEYRGSAETPARLTENPVELALISGHNAKAALSECRRIATKGAVSWRRIARESLSAFDPSCAARIAVIASSQGDFEGKLARVVMALEKSPEKAMSEADGVYFRPRSEGGPVAFLFSGQGSQYVGMGGGLAMHFDCARHVWDLSEQVLSEMGWSPRDFVFPRPVFDAADRQRHADLLTRTENAQPALAVASLAQLAVLNALGIRPDFTAGHSFGELVALHAAGCFSAKDLLRMARRRGELMAAGTQAGAMTAVSHTIGDLKEFLQASGPNGVVVANHNSPRQAVLSGPVVSIEAAEKRLTAASISFRRLPVGGAFHSPLMAGAVDPFSQFIENVALRSPLLPVFSNSEGAVYPLDPALIRQQIATNLTKPVLFADEIHGLYEAGARVFVEVGAGSVLRQLTAHCLEGRACTNVALSQKGQDEVTHLWHTLAQLSVAGLKLQFENILPAFHPASAESPSKRSASTVLIDGAGYNRPYPPKRGSEVLPKPSPEQPSVRVASASAPSAQSTPTPQPSGPPPAHGTSAFELIQLQIAEAQKASQAAILESLSITLKSMEVVAQRLAGGVAPVESHTLPEQPPQSPATAPAHFAPLPEPSSPSKPAAGDLGAVLLEIVAEKTGYPQSVITLDVELEAGLGIDSIKRVEIFSAVRQRLPGLLEVTPAAMGQLNTLRDVLALLGESDIPAAKSEHNASAPDADVERALLEIVAEKTGYPMDVLNLDLELETGLGIDSIKRVEIFSAVRQRIPAMPELNPEDAGRLRTLRDVLSFAAAKNNARATATIIETTVLETAIQRHELEFTPCDGSGLPVPGLFDCGRIAIIDAQANLAEELLNRLRELNISAESASAIPDGCRGVIYLGGLRPFATPQEALRMNHEAFEIARALARGSESPLLYVSVQDTAADSGAWTAGLAGIAKTFAREWPRCAVKTIDLEQGLRSPGEIAHAIVAELLLGGLQLEVALRADGSRLIPVLRPAEAVEGAKRIGADSVIVASGGGRGVTAACLIELARSARPRIAIIGRTPLDDEPDDCRSATSEAELKHALSRRPGKSADVKEISREAARILAAREIRSTLRALEQAGSPCAYFAADMRDAASVTRAVASARESFGPITAVIHGAGIIADKLIADKKSDQFALVFQTKADGLLALLAATESDPIDTICLFSSVAGRFGNPGQCDYAAANEALNRVAALEARRRGSHCLVRSIAWGPWEGGMVTAPLAAHFRSRGVSLIPLAAGARAFVRELLHSSEIAEVLIAAGGEPVFETAPKNEHSTQVLVNQVTYPFLDSHRIRQQVTIPVVLVNEWFHRLAEERWAGMEVVHCRDLRVLRGIPVPLFASEGQLLQITARAAAPDEIRCELRSPAGTLHYSASLEMRSGDGRHAGPAVKPCLSSCTPKTGTTSEVYTANGDLFHGPDFQVIEELSNLEESQVAATLRTVKNMRWGSGPWKTEAAALDGVLQLVRLWGVRHMGGPSLPTRIGSFIRHGGAAPETLICEVRPRAVGNLSIVADAFLHDADGRRFAEIREIEMHLALGS